jgi:OmpA family
VVLGHGHAPKPSANRAAWTAWPNSQRSRKRVQSAGRVAGVQPLSAANLAPSQQRAEAARNTLIGMGVPEDFLQAKGYGDTKPIAGNDRPEGRFQNRRISYTVVQ